MDAPGQVSTFSFFDPEYRSTPYPVLARLRARDPVHQSPMGWVITRYADVVQVTRDPRCGRDIRRAKGAATLAARFAGHKALLEAFACSIIYLDPPDHTRLRRVVAFAFTPKAIEQMEESVERAAKMHLDRLPARGSIELMGDLAKPLPVTVICDLIQVPLADYPAVEHWSELLAETAEFTATQEQLAAANRAYLEFKDYLARFVAERRVKPGTGLIDRLIQGERESGALTSDELLSNIILLLVAGHETTTNLIGNGMLALLEHPEQLALLRQNPSLLNAAVEECLRYETPANMVPRYYDEDIELGGKRIERGEPIICMLGAANRDPQAFADPDRFDITRSPNPHHSFGGGHHYCIGAHLARLQGRVALRRLFERYGSIALERERVEWRGRINLRGLRTLGLSVE